MKLHQGDITSMCISGDGNVSFEEFVEIVSNMGAATDRTADQEEKELRDAFRVSKWNKKKKVWNTKCIHLVELKIGGATFISLEAVANKILLHNFTN